MNIKTITRQQPITSYLLLTFFISWAGASIFIIPKLLHGETIPKLDGLLMFPVMLIGPGFTGIMLTRLVYGREGSRQFRKQLLRWRVSIRWYAALLIAPVTVLSVLFLLRQFVSKDFTPNFFPIGVLFGIPAGIVEELGWTGFAFPTLQMKYNYFSAAVILGLFWGFWHLPVIDFLGTASPHGKWLITFFLCFISAMTAMRVIISWVYTHTQSILIAQLMHVISTGSLVVFGPSPLSALKETIWYGVYAAALWVIAGLISRSMGTNRDGYANISIS